MQAQPLRNPDNEATRLDTEQEPNQKTPLIFRGVASHDSETRSVDEAIARIRESMREIAHSALSEAERRQALQELYERNARIFKAESTPGQIIPLTADEAVLKLELLIFEVAMAVAPDEKSRDAIITDAPRHLHLEPNRPILIAPKSSRSDIVVTREAEAAGEIAPWWKTTRFDTEALDLAEVPESPEKQLEPPEENDEEKDGDAVTITVAVDEKATVEMHDDTTILREVETARGDIVLLDALNVWIGGAVQYEIYAYEDLLNARRGGDREEDTAMRRGELIVRSTLYDLGELKLQYDLDSNIWRDLYFRKVIEEKGMTLTIGNQNEPMSQESLLGNKFNAAMEVAAPTSTFGSYRGAGVALNNWFQREKGEQFLGIGAPARRYISTAVGIFGQDIEDSNDTDLALTGRLTWGHGRDETSGWHLGLSGTLRDGEFDSINPRPGISQADRIVLARFDAETAAVVGGEFLYTRGSLHASSEIYLADYSGGDVDAQGFGGFLEVGYFLTGEQRTYRPKWGLWAPMQVGARNIFELFGRVSYTHGDADDMASNDLRMITVGGSWYRHKFRTSLNLLYGRTDRDIEEEDAGFGATMRVQYLF